MVIWLLGISGSGKTTLAKELKRYFDKKNIKSYIIDGDLVRNFFDRDLGYSKKERIENIKRVMISAKVLEDNKIIPIVANISPFEHLREFARKKFNRYIEIYLKRDLENIKNKEFVYSDKNVVGVDLEFEEPKSADLMIDTGKESIEDSLKKIIKLIEKELNINKFDEWNVLKQKTNKIKRQITIKPREIWWVKIGQNIGDEIYGKDENFVRPVVVIRRLTKDIFIGIPLSTQIKKGSYFYTFEYFNKDKNNTIKNSALLLQIRSFSIKRVMNKCGKITIEDFNKMLEHFKLIIAPAKN